MRRWGIYGVRVGLVLALMGCGDDGASTPTGDTDSGSTTGDPGSTTGSGSTSTAAADSSSSGEPLAFCEDGLALRYDPAAKVLDAFPDDVFTSDAATPTGLQVALLAGDNLILSGITTAFATVFEQANSLDGFGTTSGFYFRVDGVLDPASLPTSAADAADGSESVVLVDLDADPPAFLPFEWHLVPEASGSSETTLLLEPMTPMRPGHRHGVAMTQRVRGVDGRCVVPSEPMLALLQGGGEPPLDRVQAPVDRLVETLAGAGTIRGAQDLSAAVVFTTQTTLDDTTAVAEEIRSTQAPGYTPQEEPCTEATPEDDYRTCRGSLDVLDFTGEDEALLDDLGAVGSYDLPLVAYLPAQGQGPFPTMVYGHGLGGSRDQAALLARLFGPRGFAVVAVDAPKHGDHPDGGDDSVLDFFGLSLNFADPLDALKLRDNFRQGSFDRMQLVESIVAGIDLDGDGEDDLDGDRLHYLGVSLGGIMGPGLVAYVPEFETATFVVPGARVTSVVRDGASFSSLLNIFAQAATDGEIARFFPVVQSVIDRGDAGVFAPHVLPGTRLAGFDAAAPSVLVQMVIGDETVPNSTNRFFTRALGVPHVGEELQPVGVVSREPELPTAANVDAEHTAGMFQFDIVEGGGPATHSGIAVSEVGQLQIRHFVTTAADGLAELVDPYAELGVK